MIPDDVEKIIMTKEDYDRNVEQLLYDKINAEQKVERLNNIINELEKELDLNLPFKVMGVRRLKNKLQELNRSDKE